TAISDGSVSMVARLARFVVRRRWAVLAGTIVFILLAGAVGGGVASRLSSGGFQNPNAESTKAENLVADHFHAGDPNLVFLVTAKGGKTVNDAAVTAKGNELTRKLAAEPDVAQAQSYWSLGSPPPLRSKDSRSALVLVRIPGSQDHIRDVVKVLTPRYISDDSVATVR